MRRKGKVLETKRLPSVAGLTHCAERRESHQPDTGSRLLTEMNRGRDLAAAVAPHVQPPSKSNRPALIGRWPMTKVGRAVEKGETQSFVKIIVDAQTHEILGTADTPKWRT